jgi:hypothetical protein
MKKIITICAAILLTANMFAQSPNKMSYQAVIRNASNALVTNQAIGMRISILQNSPSGTAVYVETQTPTTNTNGLASIEIGGGTIVSGNFASINWANGPYFVKTETDPSGGNNYTITGTSQLLSVPYAFYSQTTGDTTLWRKNGNDIYTLKNVGIGKINDGTSTLDIGGRYIQIAKDSSGESGLVKNIPLNTPGYDGSLILGFVPQYSTVELHHQYGGYNGGANANNFYTTFNSTEGGVSAGERMRIAPNGNIGIGTTNPQRSLHVSAVMRLEPIATAPTSPAKGDMYFDSTLNKLRVYDGSSWQNCW